MVNITIKIKKNNDFDLIINNSLRQYVYYGAINEFNFHIKRLWKLTDNYKEIEREYED